MKTKPLSFAIPKGMTYNTYRAFLQAELSEDFPTFAMPVDDDAAETTDEGYYGRDYPNLVDFDDAMLIFNINWGDDLYQIGYTIGKGAEGRDVRYADDPPAPIAVGQVTTYVPVAQMTAKTPHVAPARAEAQKRTSLASFALGSVTDARDDAWVTRRGVVFEAGEFPDIARQLGIDALVFGPEELRTMVDSFERVPNRVSHANGDDRTPTIFDAHMGTLESLAVSDDGKQLIGAVKIPKWLDDYQRDVRGGGPLQASLEIDPVTYRVVGNTIIPNPRIETSALMSAYAAFTAKEKGMAEKKEGEPEVVSAAEFAQLKADRDADRIEMARLREEARKSRQDRAIESALREGRMLPAQRAHFEQLHKQAGEDDAARPATINFTVGTEAKTGSRVDALEAAIAAMPKLLLTRELVPGQDAILQPQTDDEEKQLIAAAAKQGAEFAEHANAMENRGRTMTNGR